jgi:cyclophilin family peptidyl-prolyl cis-trans isomerase
MSALAAQRPAVKQAALEVLAAAPVDRGMREQITALIGHADPAIRAAAVQALAGIDPEQLAFVLSGTDPDPVWFVRSALAKAAGVIGGDLGLGLAFAALQDRDARVVPAALETLRRLKGSDAVDTLRKQTDQPDIAVRATAVAALAALRATDLLPVLGGAYALSLGDEEPYARAAIVEIAARERGDAATALLRSAAEKDPLAALRHLAGAALAKRGITTPAGPPDRQRAFVDYRVALAPLAPVAELPLFTPRMFLRTSRGSIEVHLNVVEAPLASAAFASLARRGFFNDQSFDRTSMGLALEAGCPRGDGFGGPGFTLQREVGQYAFGRGAVALLPVRGLPDTVGSRFLITPVPTPALDGHATLLGWVVSGWDALESLRPGDSLERIEVWAGR